LKKVFLIPAGTNVSISRGGSGFEPHTTREPYQFEAPLLRTSEEMIFAKGDSRVLVNRASVIVNLFEGIQR
jgi:hypothetical protein